ncbi:hypothetical protein NIES4074_66090 [Cylindrospermum sp. NIES-4074]|nr:hypothetical protein NIES4074_66090 [Cylindrospermum sp. NIES-4074]
MVLKSQIQWILSNLLPTNLSNYVNITKFMCRFLLTKPKIYLFILKAIFLLGTIRVGFKLLLFQQMRGLLAKIAQPRAKLQRADEASVNKFAWAVTVASR